ncbi:MAG: hypothetical protein L3J36_14880 [Rhodobacteraceae bacterium]|nr:hypothetical protein [Paracoccaceae bacterium]
MPGYLPGYLKEGSVRLMFTRTRRTEIRKPRFTKEQIVAIIQEYAAGAEISEWRRKPGIPDAGCRMPDFTSGKPSMAGFRFPNGVPVGRLGFPDRATIVSPFFSISASSMPIVASPEKGVQKVQLPLFQCSISTKSSAVAQALVPTMTPHSTLNRTSGNPCSTLRRMDLTSLVAAALLAPDFLFIFTL